MLCQHLVNLKLVRIIARGVGNFLTNFYVSGTFHSRLMGQHVRHAPRDLNLWRWRSWHLAVIRVFVLHLCTMFEVLPARKIWCTFGRGSWPGDLETGAHYCLWGGQPCYQFMCFWDVSFLIYGPTSVRRTTISRSWPLTLEVTALVSDMGLHLYSKFELQRTSRL